MKIGALGASITSLLAILVFLSGKAYFSIMPLFIFLPLSATLTMFAAYSHPTPPKDLLTILILLGLGLCFMMIPGMAGLLSIGGVFVVLIFLLLRQKSQSRFSVLWGIGLYGFALAAMLISLIFSPPTASILLLLAYAILLPICPLHGASIVSFSRLGGIFPNFLALFLPALGLKGVLGILPDLPPGLMNIVSIFSLIGAVYGGFRALVQNNICHRLSYAGLTFWSILWWYLANTGMETAPAILYFCALALIMQGLFISGYCLEKRQGNLNLDQLGGLARLMPRFGVLLSLLVAAGMGLPLLGSFSALISVATSPEIILSRGFVIVLLAWLLASWYFPVFMQHILLGPPKPDRIYPDLVTSEKLSLTLIVAMIVILGIAPYAFFGSGAFPARDLPVQEVQSRLK
ncbi:MAG: proton-conducting transporter membrane subunit [Nitrospiria bacterium]